MVMILLATKVGPVDCRNHSHQHKQVADLDDDFGSMIRSSRTTSQVSFSQ